MMPTEISTASFQQDVLVFLLLTVLLGGAASWRAGQAVAQSWQPVWPVIAYALLLAFAARFLHYALFSGPLLSLPHLALDFAVLVSVGLLAHRVRRTRHMTEQYPWLFRKVGPLSWRSRGGW
jgi:hypothetical protein